jgi:hypothetical protein
VFRRIRFLAPLLSLVLATTLAAADPLPPPAPAPTVTIPAEVKIQPGRLASIVIESNGKLTRFGCLDSAVDLFREYDPDPSKIRLRVIVYTPGKYAIYAYTAMGDVPSELAVCWVTVGEPKPVPPVDPPTPPAPDDPLFAGFQAAYKADLAAGKAKAEYLAGVEAVFRQASTDGLTTVGQFQELLKKAIGSKALMPAGSMPNLSAAVAAAMKANFPNDGNTLFNDDLRRTTTKFCLRVADCLKGVSP